MPQYSNRTSQYGLGGSREVAHSSVDPSPFNRDSQGQSRDERGRPVNLPRRNQTEQSDISSSKKEHGGIRQTAQSVQSMLLGNNSAMGASSSVPTPPQTGHTGPQISASDFRIVQSWSHRKLVDELFKSWEKSDDRKAENRSLLQQLVAERDQNSELQERLSRQDLDVRQAQESAFTLMASNALKAEDDDVICSKFKTIRGRWKQFAKEWATRDLPKSQEEISVISQIFTNLAASDEGQSPDGLWSRNNERKACTILLNAELGRFIGREIIQRPFITTFNLGMEPTNHENGDSSVMKTLEMMYSMFLKENRVDAHLWRSHTVGLLDPESHLSTSESHTYREARDRRERYYGKLVHDFESSNVTFLYRQCDDQENTRRWEQLFEIFSSIGELTSRLWSQKVFISVLGAKELLKQPFRADSKDLEAHAAHRLEVGDTSMDGMPIQMVVEPAVVAWGNERGECYDTRKVWSEAVVWMSSGARLTEAALSEANNAAAQASSNVSGLGGAAA